MIKAVSFKEITLGSQVEGAGRGIALLGLEEIQSSVSPPLVTMEFPGGVTIPVIAITVPQA